VQVLLRRLSSQPCSLASLDPAEEVEAFCVWRVAVAVACDCWLVVEFSIRHITQANDQTHLVSVQHVVWLAAFFCVRSRQVHVSSFDPVRPQRECLKTNHVVGLVNKVCHSIRPLVVADLRFRQKLCDLLLGLLSIPQGIKLCKVKDRKAAPSQGLFAKLWSHHH
jgi:hypothetical protein